MSEASTRASLVAERAALVTVHARVAATAARCESALCFTPAAQANRDALGEQHRTEAAALAASIARLDDLIRSASKGAERMAAE